MQLRNDAQRDMHEKMLHRDLFEKAADRWVKAIVTNAQASDAKKKVFALGSRRLSYEEIAAMAPGSEDYQNVRHILARFITDWVDNHPKHTVEDFFRMLRFSITNG